MINLELDYLVIGGGIYGSYAANFLSDKGVVALVEKETSIFSGASKWNQARLHRGVHYLRAPKTAKAADKYHDRFIKEFAFAINHDISHIYGIARHGSLTNPIGFERFCNWLKIEAKEIENSANLNPSLVEKAYLIPEYSYDPFLLASYFRGKLEESKTQLLLETCVVEAKKVLDHWEIYVKSKNGTLTHIKTKCVVNATYSNLNSVTGKFNLTSSKLKHEYSELLLVYAPNLKKIAITIMDGPFLSITPYGLTGLHALSSVAYTHHSSTKSNYKKMSCQVSNGVCSVDDFLVCQSCKSKPPSAENFFLNQIKSFIPDLGDLYVHASVSVIKSILQNDDERDEREATVKKLHSDPDFYEIISGKVTSIFELEQIHNVNK